MPLLQETVSTYSGYESLFRLINVILAFVVVYIASRIRNYATKQDIGDITLEVEKVKKGFSEQQAFLENRLSIRAQIKIDASIEVKKIIIDLNGVLYEWRRTLNKASVLGDGELGFLRTHQTYQDRLLDIQSEFNNLLGKLFLFIREEDFINELNPLYEELTLLSNTVTDYLFNSFDLLNDVRVFEEMGKKTEKADKLTEFTSTKTDFKKEYKKKTEEAFIKITEFRRYLRSILNAENIEVIED